jgi:hypothetical protein
MNLAIKEEHCYEAGKVRGVEDEEVISGDERLWSGTVEELWNLATDYIAIGNADRRYFLATIGRNVSDYLKRTGSVQIKNGKLEFFE